MITDQNKWAIIEAYLTGHLDEAGRQEVTLKMDSDSAFRADVLMQAALHQHLDQEQSASDYALVYKFLSTQQQTVSDYELVDKFLSTQVKQPAPSPGRSLPFWQQTWVRAVAGVLLLLGLGWFSHRYWSAPKELSVKMTYEQRELGMAGTTTRLTTYPVVFSDDGPAGGEYSSEAGNLHVYLPNLPTDAQRWRLRDEPDRGGFQLTTPQGQTYLIDRDTYGQRKPLN